MKIAPITANEPERLAALRRYAILDTPDEAVFDDFTWLASQICAAPISLISLVDTGRQWFKSRVGLNATETPRELAFCAHAIHGDEIMEVPNALIDDRFHDNPLVTGAPDIRFYAGMPLTTPDGFNLGTLCVIDRVPRTLSAEQRGALARLGRQVVVQLELRRSILERQRNEQRLALQNEVSRILAECPGLSEAMPRLLEVIGVGLGYKFGAAWNVDPMGKFLQCVEVCHAPGDEMTDFGRESRQVTPELGEGLPGRVWATNQPVWVADVNREDKSPRSGAAVAAGLRGAFGFPILLGERCLGVVEFFRGEVAEIDAELLQVLATMGRQIGEFIERERIRKKLEHEEFLLHTLMENVPESIYFKDSQSRFLRNSRAQLERFGIANPMLAVGKTDFDFFDEKHALQAFEDEQQVMKSGQPISRDEEIIRADGSVSWVVSNKMPLRNGAGDIIGTFGISHDVTEIKRAQDELRLMNSRAAETSGATVLSF